MTAAELLGAAGRVTPAAQVIAAATASGVTIATAESLTGGSVCAALAGVPGASAVLQGGVVAYQNTVKMRVLGVAQALLDEAGSVDGRVAAQMAFGARAALNADIGVATTGVAGPDPHDGKPVGTVFVAVADGAGRAVWEYRFNGGRAAVRAAAEQAALAALLDAVARTDR